MPLSECMWRPGQSLTSAIKSTGAALHHAPHLPSGDLRGPLELRDFGVEIKEIAQASDNVSAPLPQVGVPLEASLDIDACYISDPAALDVGQFLAYLRFWCAVFRPQGVRQLREQFLAGYNLGAPGESLLCARHFEALELVKLRVHRARRFERDWTRRITSLFGYAQFLLGQLWLSLGSLGKRPVSLGAPGRVSSFRATLGGRRHQSSANGGLVYGRKGR